MRRLCWLAAVAGPGSANSPVGGCGKDVAVFPFALTNPIFLDTNRNGKYDPVLPHHGKNATEPEGNE